MVLNAFLEDVLGEPEALQQLLDEPLEAELRVFARERLTRDFSRIVVTGMGASHCASYPAYLALAGSGLPVWHLDTSELLHDVGALVDSRTLLWIVSQSGHSAEAVRLAQERAGGAAAILALTNDVRSPLASAADVVCDLRAGEEHTASTKTYVNTLAASRLILEAAGVCEPSLLQARLPELLAAYLDDASAHLAELESCVRSTAAMVAIGRGASLANALATGLLMKEVARVGAEGMRSAAFRHGPMEIGGPELTLVAFGGDPLGRALTAGMAEETGRHGTQVLWLGPGRPAGPVQDLAIPEAPHGLRHLVEIAPVQLLASVLAERAGLAVGVPGIIEKVTVHE